MKAFVGWIVAGLIVVAIGGEYYLSSAGAGMQAGLASMGQLAAHPIINLLLGLVFIGVATILSLLQWERMDEAQREAHKSAWYWGAGCGLILPMPFALLCGLARPGSVFGGGLGGEAIFAFSYWVILICAILGYTGAWSVWWLRRR